VGDIGGYRDLLVWQKAMLLVTAVYRSSGSWPKEEQYGLTSQLRRAAVSVPANIAEGQGRTGTREFAHHLSIANGSLHETETLIFVAHNVRFIDQPTCDELLRQSSEVGRLLNGLLRRFRTRE
jgi:four helix bundle protein